MPHYDYACKFCGHTLEAFQRMSEDPLKKCPECKRMGLQRQIGTGAGIIFKGSGFYETDFKNKPSKGASEKTDKSEGKSDSKPTKEKAAATKDKA